MSTIHNPSQFQPQDYVVVDYFDNNPPAYTGGSVEGYNLERERWANERDTLFPDRNCYKCQHCGNGNVRYVVAVSHVPTGKTICFGADCAARLEFPNAKAFKLAQLQARAAAGHARMRIWNDRQNLLKARPELAQAVEQAKGEIHKDNSFARDVLSDLDTYGNLSESQISALLRSLARDVQRDNERKNDNRPALVNSPRARRVGEVVSIKTQESAYGVQFKMLVKLEDGNKLWGTVPSTIEAHVGDKIEFFAPVEVSQKDPHFGFYSRPTKAKTLVNGPEHAALLEQQRRHAEAAAAADTARLAEGIRPVAA